MSKKEKFTSSPLSQLTRTMSVFLMVGSVGISFYLFTNVIRRGEINDAAIGYAFLICCGTMFGGLFLGSVGYCIGGILAELEHIRHDAEHERKAEKAAAVAVGVA